MSTTDLTESGGAKLRLTLSPYFRVVVGSLSSVSTWSPLQMMTDHTTSSDILIPLNPTDPQPGTVVLKASSFQSILKTFRYTLFPDQYNTS